MSSGHYLNILIAEHLRHAAKKFNRDNSEDKNRAKAYLAAARGIENNDNIITSGYEAKSVISGEFDPSISQSIDIFLANFNRVLAFNLRDKIDDRLAKKIKNSEVPITSAETAKKEFKGLDEKDSDKIDNFIRFGPQSNTKDRDNIINHFASFYGISQDKAKIYYLSGYRTMDDIFENEDTRQSTKNDYMWKDNTNIKIDNKNMDEIAEKITELLDGVDFSFVGDYALGEDDINRISLIVKSPSAEDNISKILEKLEEIFPEDSLLSKTVDHYFGIVKVGDYLVCYIDILLVIESEFPTKVLFATGPEKFVNLIIKKADDTGFKLTDEGLYRKEDDEKIKLNLVKEADIFRTLKLRYIDQRKRKNISAIETIEKTILSKSKPKPPKVNYRSLGLSDSFKWLPAFLYLNKELDKYNKWKDAGSMFFIDIYNGRSIEKAWSHAVKDMKLKEKQAKSLLDGAIQSASSDIKIREEKIIKTDKKATISVAINSGQHSYSAELAIPIERLNKLLFNRPKDQTQFIYDLLIRYVPLRPSEGMFWGLPPDIYSDVFKNIVETEDDIIEGFASPFNNNLKRFCSVFEEDKNFGSIGSFFDVFPETSASVWIINPPYTEYVLGKVKTVIEEKLEHNKDEHYFFLLPTWKDENLYKFIELNENGFHRDFSGGSYITHNYMTGENFTPGRAGMTISYLGPDKQMGIDIIKNQIVPKLSLKKSK